MWGSQGGDGASEELSILTIIQRGRVIIRKIPASRLPACKPFYFIFSIIIIILFFAPIIFWASVEGFCASCGPKGPFQWHGNLQQNGSRVALTQ